MAAGGAAAQSVKLKANEIEALLSGNTVVGKWDGTTYRQFFDADGTTIFAQDGMRSALGQWRIDPERDEYQSIWPRDAAWEGWYVMEYAGDYFWVSKKTPPTPFAVVEGQQLVNTEQENPFCGQISRFAEHLDSTETTVTVDVDFPDTPHATCSRSIATGGAQSVHCSWPFAYRSVAARQNFDTLLLNLAQCFDKGITVSSGQGVNHPDSYDLRLFTSDKAAITASLKDKGALQQTFVFLRAESLR